MPLSSSRLALLGLAFAAASAAATPAVAELLTERNVSSEMALTIVQTAMETCKGQGYRVSIHVMDRSGAVKAALRGDGANPHTFENSMRKAYTARTFRMPSGEFAKRSQEPGRGGQLMLTNVIAIQGGLPLMVGDDVVGSVGVSGAPGGDKDEVCAKAGIDKVADQLK
jgi:uncharacterized protein GlcG (DUF336 family)